MINPKKHLCEVDLAEESMQLLEDNKQIYYNPIIKEKTIWEYRFKTEEEFLEQYGYNWENDITRHIYGGIDYLWVSNMNYLFGTDFNQEIPNKHEYVTIPRKDDPMDRWFITYPMLTKKDIKPFYMLSKEERNKRFVRESNVKKLKDF